MSHAGLVHRLPWMLGTSLAILLGTSLIGPSTSVGAQPANDVPELGSRIAAILQRNSIAGAGVSLVNRDGVIWTDGIGIAERATGRQATADTTFRVGSISKVVTAMALMQLVDQGKLSLDAHLRDVAPEVEFQNPWEPTDPVTVGMLLEHTAGFELGRFNEDFESQPMPLLSALELNPGARVSRWPPATRMAYSNEGYLIAGYLIEKLTGRSFDEVLQNGIFDPLGMSQAAFQAWPTQPSSLAVGYDLEGRAQTYLEDRQRPAANMLASPDDMSRLLEFWVRGGDVNTVQLLSPASIDRMLHRETLPYAGPEEQYGIGLATQQYGGFVARGHTGYTLGFTASMRFFPTQGVGWVLMLNGGEAGNARYEIEQELLQFLMASVAKPTPEPAQSTDDDLQALAGYYADAAPNQQILAPFSDVFGGIDIRVQDGSLWERMHSSGNVRAMLLPNDPWMRLVRVAPDAFRTEDQSISSLYFGTASDGSRALVTAEGFYERSSMALSIVRRALVEGALIVVLSALVVGPLLILRAFFAEHAPAPAIGASGGLCAALVLIALWALLTRSPELLGHVNATTLAVFGLTSAFGLLTLVADAATALTLFDRSGVPILVRGYLLLVALASSGLAVFALCAGWIGLRTWAW